MLNHWIILLTIQYKAKFYSVCHKWLYQTVLTSLHYHQKKVTWGFSGNRLSTVIEFISLVTDYCNIMCTINISKDIFTAPLHKIMALHLWRQGGYSMTQPWHEISGSYLISLSVLKQKRHFHWTLETHTKKNLLWSAASGWYHTTAIEAVGLSLYGDLQYYRTFLQDRCNNQLAFTVIVRVHYRTIPSARLCCSPWRALRSVFLICLQ